MLFCYCFSPVVWFLYIPANSCLDPNRYGTPFSLNSGSFEPIEGGGGIVAHCPRLALGCPPNYVSQSIPTGIPYQNQYFCIGELFVSLFICVFISIFNIAVLLLLKLFFFWLVRSRLRGSRLVGLLQMFKVSHKMFRSCRFIMPTRTKCGPLCHGEPEQYLRKTWHR